MEEKLSACNASSNYSESVHLHDEAHLPNVYELEEAGISSACVAVLTGQPFTVSVRRPVHTIREQGCCRNIVAGAAAVEAEEVLRVWLTLRRRQFYHMNLFINLPSASSATPIASTPNFASAFNHTPLLSPQHQQQAEEEPELELEGEEPLLHTILFSIGIGDIVSQLGLSLHPQLLLTFVPTGRFKDTPVTINDIIIDLE
ncbi:hypothetical protein GOP47_0011956 [Adiantum capillus-veneris]|uniref:Uncharacterized protein n=1 Tax=Adiantum capillus-veneris TaxID=13818 RepID=A0A9D4ZFV3_ADICA|nr:hypothetical protein GOP47_0011956 [Adiantum capillus-veneris]